MSPPSGKIRVKGAIVMAAGPGAHEALDTLESIARYCPEEHLVVIVDDHTTDGTFEALTRAKRENWVLLRNAQNMGVGRLVHTLSRGYRYLLENVDADIVLKFDTDALVIGPSPIRDAAEYAASNSGVGIFGVYSVDHDRPRSFEFHAEIMRKELGWRRRLAGRSPSWRSLWHRAERNGYRLGDNVFGGAYFVTPACLRGMLEIGALDVPFEWNSTLQEDVYFSMAAVAAGKAMGHFAAPGGPLCMDWRGLPMKASDLVARGFKIVHSVDKGRNTSAEENGGLTARQFFRKARCS